MGHVTRMTERRNTDILWGNLKKRGPLARPKLRWEAIKIYLKEDRRCTYNVLLKRVRESLLPLKSDNY